MTVLMAYASRTGTARNLAAMRAHGWRILISATGPHRHEGFTAEVGSGYVLDNGAWTSRGGGEWDSDAFDRLLEGFGQGADWAVAPEHARQPADGEAQRVGATAYDVDSTPKVLIAVQNGMQPGDVDRFLGARVGIAIGGGCASHSPALRFGLCSDCDWKEQSAITTWGPLAREAGCHLHMLRVNTARRIQVCHAAGVDSFDGTSVTKYATTIRKLDAARRLVSLGFHV
jgi:hypothetical protein